MAYKRVDGYHDNKGTKDVYFDEHLDRHRITGSERLYGMEIELEFNYDAGSYECSECDGTGNVQVEIDCSECGGTGSVEVENEETGELTTMECPECDGSGLAWEYQDCESCNGRGEIDYDDDDDADLSYLTDDIPDSLEDTFVLERDGSLDAGFEVITEPMTYLGVTNWLNNSWLRGVLDASISTGHAGVHIHVSKPNIETIRKLVVFFLKYGSRLGHLTRFSSYGAFYQNEYSHIESDEFKKFVAYLIALDDVDDLDVVPENLDGMGGFDTIRSFMRTRYMAINFQNRHTLEFRFFNYTDDAERLKSYIYFLETLFTKLELMTLREVIETEFVLRSLTDFEPITRVTWSNLIQKTETKYKLNTICIDNTMSRDFNGSYPVYVNGDDYGWANRDRYGLCQDARAYEQRLNRRGDLQKGMIVWLDSWLMQSIRDLMADDKFGNINRLVNKLDLFPTDILLNLANLKQKFIITGTENYFGASSTLLYLQPVSNIGEFNMPDFSQAGFKADAGWVSTVFTCQSYTNVNNIEIIKESEVL